MIQSTKSIKSKSKFHHVRVPILNDEYWVDVCWGDKKQTLKFARKKFQDPDIPSYWFDDHARGKVFRRPTFNPMVYLFIGPKDKHFWATLAHEACHAIDEIYAMIEENGARHEVYAHSVGAVVAAVEKYLKK